MIILYWRENGTTLEGKRHFYPLVEGMVEGHYGESRSLCKRQSYPRAAVLRSPMTRDAPTA